MKTQIRDPELARLLAAVRFDIAILRLSALELKYRADQARQPAGAPDGQGGEFADEGRGHARGGVAQAGDGLTHRLRGMLPTQPYHLHKPDIVVPPAVATPLGEMGNAFYQQTGRTMVVMSGNRGPQAQADAMYGKFAKGDRGGVYRDQAAMKQIRDQYDAGVKAGLTKAQTVDNMRAVIDHQIAHGTIISKHMVGKAVDLQTHGLSRHQQNLLNHTAQDHGFHAIPEGIPPHLHVQVR